MAMIRSTQSYLILLDLIKLLSKASDFFRQNITQTLLDEYETIQC